MLDNYDLWVQHDRRQQKQLERLPVCAYCDEPIQDDFYYEIEGEIICKHCLDENFRKTID